jgi:hypothetical protein
MKTFSKQVGCAVVQGVEVLLSPRVEMHKFFSVLIAGVLQIEFSDISKMQLVRHKFRYHKNTC